MQLVDELAMTYTSCILFYAVFSHGSSKPTKYLVALFISSVAVFITAYYHYIKDPRFHQNTFALLTTIVVFRSIYLMEKLLQPRTVTGQKDRNHSDRSNAEVLRNMRIMAVCGLGAVAIGFVIWKLDTIFCSTLRRWRRDMGLPWGMLLEGHGWW